MNIEQSIKDTITKKLEDGTIEKLIGQELEKGVKNALENLFRSYGDVTKIIEEKVKSVMVPYLESYDYSRYIVKLDSVLQEVLKSAALENKKLLENFGVLMTSEKPEKTIKVTELFDKWMDYVAKEVSTSDLKIDYDDGVSYENVEVRFEVDYNEQRSWSHYEYANLVFECEKDEDMNFVVSLSRWKDGSDKGWDIRYDKANDIKSLRHMNDFEMLLMQLSQNYVKLIIDKDYDDCEVEVEAEPEVSFS